MHVRAEIWVNTCTNPINLTETLLALTNRPLFVRSKAPEPTSSAKDILRHVTPLLVRHNAARCMRSGAFALVRMGVCKAADPQSPLEYVHNA
eukprot:364743-Chlamydomonas_euryale.AAC.69